MQNRAPKGTRISHVGIALSSIADALPFYRDVLGMEETAIADSDGARISAVTAGESLVELLEPEMPTLRSGDFSRGEARESITSASQSTISKRRSSDAEPRGSA